MRVEVDHFKPGRCAGEDVFTERAAPAGWVLTQAKGSPERVGARVSRIICSTVLDSLKLMLKTPLPRDMKNQFVRRDA